MKVIFLGTPEIAVPALRALTQHAEVMRVVTQPDRPAGRGHHMQASPVKIAAQELGIPVWQPETLRGAQNAAELQGVDAFIVMAYGELLRQRVLDLPRLGCFNLHASLLPRWRGASPLQAVIRAGDAQTGVTVMRMVRALDAGPIYLQERIPLDETSTLPWLHDVMAERAAIAVSRFYSERVWEMEPIAQDGDLVTTCGKLSSDDGCLSWACTRQELDRWVRAYTPAPGCWVPFQGQRLRILGLEPRGDDLVEPGMLRREKHELWVACRDGWLAITRLQSPGKRALDAREWLHGNTVPLSFSA
jgi:methionyl-tRNA formyltransferase